MLFAASHSRVTQIHFRTMSEVTYSLHKMAITDGIGKISLIFDSFSELILEKREFCPIGDMGNEFWNRQSKRTI